MPAIGLYIIGDEILSGKRADKHLPKFIKILQQRGLQLSWANYLGDDPARITAAFKQSLAGTDIVFSTGGIGATPDDHTRQCVANALGRRLELHPQAKVLIQQRAAEMAAAKGETLDLQAPEQLQRLKMGEFPQGAELIPNSFNRIPGFAIRLPDTQHYFVPGFPEMAWSMMEWVLDTHYPHLFHQTAWAERALWVYEVPESALTPLMEQLEQQFPQIKVFSLPSVATAERRACIELGVKGSPEQVAPAFAAMQAHLQQRHAEFQVIST